MLLHRQKVALVTAGIVTAVSAGVIGAAVAVNAANPPAVRAHAAASHDGFAEHLAAQAEPVAAALLSEVDSVEPGIASAELSRAIADAKVAAADVVTVQSSKAAMWAAFDAHMARMAEASAALRAAVDVARAEADARALAAIEAERAASTPTPAPAPDGGPPTSSTAGMSDAERLRQITAALGLPLPPVVLGSCPQTGHGAGCYTLGSGQIVVSEFALTMRDCTIANVIAHEYRHYWQEQNGRILANADGSISNVAELEADANAFAATYGCP